MIGLVDVATEQRPEGQSQRFWNEIMQWDENAEDLCD